MKRVIVILVILAVMIGGTMGIYYVSAENKKTSTDIPPDAEIVTTERGLIKAQVNATGNVAAEALVSLGFKTSGRVAKVLIEEGDTVTEGQVLARLETAELDLQITQAEANLEISETQLQKLQEKASDYDIAAARAAVQSAQESYERVLEGPDEAEFAAAEATLISAQENYTRVLEGPDAAELAAARAAVTSAQANLDKLETGRTADEITVARAELKRTQIALEQAQSEYDKIAWTNQVGMTPQAAQLEQATVAYEAALANYNIALEGFSDREVLAAAAQVAQAESTLASLLKMPRPADVAAAQAQIEQAESALDKLRDMPHSADVAAAQAQVEQAQASLDRLLEAAKDTDITIAEAQVKQAKVSLEQAKLAKENAVLKAPRKGKVARSDLRVGEFVSVGAPVMQIVCLTNLHIDVLIDEIDINAIEPGQVAEITLDAMPGVDLSGHVTKIAPTATVEGGVISYKVTVELDDTDVKVLEGMTANVAITTERKEDALLLTNRAVQVDRETGKLFVERKKMLGTELVEIETGLRDENNVEVVRGLEEGDKVVIRTLTQAERIRATFGE